MKNESNSNIDCVFEAIDGKGAIYVSDFASASLKELRAKYNIKAVISIAYSGYIESRDELIDYLYIPAQDSSGYDISQHFQDTFNFIDKYRRTANVLVHCMVGKSRSATIVAAYLLKKYRYSLSDVMTLITRKRQIINPNPGFIKQLQQYCTSIGVAIGEDWRSRSLSKHKRRNTESKQILSVSKNISKLSKATNDTQNELINNQKIGINEKIQKIKLNLLNQASKQIKMPLKNMYSHEKNKFDIEGKINDRNENINSMNVVWKSKFSAFIS